MPEKFLKPYNPSETESRLYKEWEESGLFNPDTCIASGVTSAQAETFSVVLPPPNVTGVLHLGHAYEDALQDAVVRFHRMRGERTLWIPGTDSAAIATQARVEKDLQKSEGKSRHDLGREELVRRVGEFAKQSEGTILNQVRRMGASLDWSRYAYTLDQERSAAVAEAFKKMYEAGLIYRGHRIVNWDPKGQTTISDDEIVYKEEQSTFYYFKYGPFAIGTSRPETKFGDKYVVMHPDDPRYAEYSDGQTFEAEWINGPIVATVIKDAAVDMSFGSGVMTITPWHDRADFDIAERHNLEKEQIIDEYGKLLPITGEFAGMKIADARLPVVERLRAKGLVVKEEPYTHNVATAERTGGIIEPQIKLQWFVDVNRPFAISHSEIAGIKSGSEITLKQLMRAAVEHGSVHIPQEGFRNAYFHWIDNLRDWCISRQIWFGHRIPVWYDGEQVFIGTEAPATGAWLQDPDVLDTWFSSALWTFSTLGWPAHTRDLKAFHPTSFMSPAYEIINLWISRMILMSGFHLGQAPFKTVLIHGVVRDKQGRKFSKSLGNGIDPIDMIEKYGADALRMGLLVGSSIGSDISFDENKVKGYKHFSNKLWNIARFVLENGVFDGNVYTGPTTDEDKALLTAFEALAKDITTDIEEYRIHLAAEKLYHYAWHEFADKILEASKPLIKTGGEPAESRKRMLVHLLANLVTLLHPFMPFITEEIWQSLPPSPGQKERSYLMVAEWPVKVR
ncbi:valine--tRNA ligase [Candidatus Kaiserbacteria bacterium CG10_big_fil_rev_8_21_14_0_10_56_12]|uniref:Valine--tRNA ligase n=1 Tax=Candidatus Kaiserbacteria bacterium CG10_big_fil_rev_8_21_14_0_10_56_12 TaxID=1974611 RepID=A0A2H0UA68_9BACT|nr:MAG: valine--tRNA ligase [Candidatus Kaiserbacteria bacterium CG10_big_fil_rev_8_21_14_0_10_56_12]